MSKDCAITKYPGSVNNDSLRRYGEMFIKTYQADTATAQTNCIRIRKLLSTTAIEVRVISGDGYLTDSDLVSNPQKQKTYNTVLTESIYFSNNDMVIGIRSKYNSIDGISIPDNTDNVIKNWGFDSKELAYANLKSVTIKGTVLTGDIAEMVKWTGSQENKGVNYSINNDPRGSIYGDINSLDGFWLNNFNSIPLLGLSADQQGTLYYNIYGNIVSYVNSNIDFSNTNNPFYILSWLKGTKVTGDLAKLDNRTVFITGSKNPNSFTWSSRTNGTHILCAENIKFAGDDSIKNYLIDNADLSLSDLSGLPKLITITGTVDLEDADVVTAINKLKTKGLTLFRINGQSMLA